MIYLILVLFMCSSGVFQTILHLLISDKLVVKDFESLTIYRRNIFKITANFKFADFGIHMFMYNIHLKTLIKMFRQYY